MCWYIEIKYSCISRRIKIGNYSIDNSIKKDDINNDKIISLPNFLNIKLLEISDDNFKIIDIGGKIKINSNEYKLFIT